MHNSQVAHEWAHQQKDSGKGSNFYYKGNTIYSYGPHFPIARIVRPGVVLFTTCGYSNTTARHKNHVMSAIYQTCFIVPDVGDSYNNIDHGANIAHYMEEINTTREKALRSRKYADQLQQNAFSLAQDLIDYMEYFKADLASVPDNVLKDARSLAKLKEKDLLFSEEESAAIKARINAAAQEKRDKAKKEEAEARIYREEWQAGKREELPYHAHGRYDLLRINGARLETTRGATVPAQVARAVYNNMVKGQNVEGVSIAGFKVTRVYDDYVIIGCHTVQRAELDRIFQS